MSRLEDVILRGLRSEQPGATTVASGTLYFVTDENTIERSNGTLWQSYSGPAGGGGTGTNSVLMFIGEDGLDGLDGFPTIGERGATGATGAAGASGSANAIPKPGITSPGLRFMSWFKNENINSSVMVAVGAAAMTITGGSGTFDTAGFWAVPTSASGSIARASTTNGITMMDHFPKLITRIRTPATITDRRFMISFNEVGGGVDTDTPSNSQRGIYVAYSTAIPDGGWIVMQRDTAGLSARTPIVALAAATEYVITIEVVSLSSVNVTINGTTVNVTANIPNTNVVMFAEIITRALAAGSASMDIESLYIESR